MRSKSTKFFLMAFGIFLILAIVFFAFFSNFRINPRVILEIEGDYETGEIFQGLLEINLQEGELIPASSKIIFVNNGSSSEYFLSDLLGEEVTQGNFYVEGSQLSGIGEGYGDIGHKKVHPLVYFKFNLYSVSGNSGGNSSGDSEIPIDDKNKTEEDDKNKTEEDYKNKTEEDYKNKTEEDEMKDEGLLDKDSDEKIKDKEKDSIVSELTITGQASLGFQKEIQGEVVYGEEYRYPFREGDTVEVIDGSVRTETQELSSDFLNLKMDSEELIITTTYFEIEEGFGEDYLGEGKNPLFINLSSLDLFFEEGNLEVYIIYEEQEIISLETSLRDKAPVSQKDDQEQIKNDSILQENVTYPLLFRSSFNIENISLTEEELEILLKNFPNQSVSRRVKEYRNWVVAEFILSDYLVEYNYDSSLDEEVLEKLMENDRIRWLKDLARKFLKEEFSYEDLPKFYEDYNITQ
jgi:hypothetical protein